MDTVNIYLNTFMSQLPMCLQYMERNLFFHILTAFYVIYTHSNPPKRATVSSFGDFHSIFYSTGKHHHPVGPIKLIGKTISEGVSILGFYYYYFFKKHKV